MNLPEETSFLFERIRIKTNLYTIRHHDESARIGIWNWNWNKHVCIEKVHSTRTLNNFEKLPGFFYRKSKKFFKISPSLDFLPTIGLPYTKKSCEQKKTLGRYRFA